VYIYYHQTYEAREHRESRSRQSRAKRIIQRASRARRERRRRRAHVTAALQRLIPRTGQFAGMDVGLEDALSDSIATRPGTSVPGRVIVRYAVGATRCASC
jgi:hypothetical protein